jgi:hypothetical protein
MVERLTHLRDEAHAHPDLNPFLADVLADRLQAALREAEAAGNAPRLLALRPALALQELNAGRTLAALRQYEAYQATLDTATWRLDSSQSADLALRTAVAHLRLGEEQNCLLHHHAESCVFPIQGAGIHALSGGSRGAIRVLTAFLKRNPHNLHARWLLNLAHMTLGSYPLHVPADQLIPPGAFASEFPMPRFQDVAGQLGVDVEDLSGGVVAEDFDNDGLIDLMVSASGLSSPLRLFRNGGDGRFHERTVEAGLSGLHGGLNLVQTDYDNDGHADVLVLRGGWLGRGGHHPNSLLRNNGDGTFDDVTEAAGLLSYHPTQTAAWFDYDGDGDLDLFVGNESRPDDPNPCELFRNNGDRTFTECARPCGLDITAFVKGVTAGDFNLDGRPDLYVSVVDGPNLLLRNDGPASPSESGWRFTEVARSAGVIEPIHSFPTWFWDYDNDGWPDLFVCGYRWRGAGDVAADYLGLPTDAERPRLYRNNRDGTFTDVTQASRLSRVILGMGANYGDFDNDGWLDFYVGTGDPDLAALVPNRAFRNAGNGTFQEVTAATGLGHLQKGHGIAFADFDNDGDQDLYAVLGGALTGDRYRNALFLNPSHDTAWVTLKLEGTRSNRAALGARIELIGESPSGLRTIHRTVSPGGSFGASPLRREIGLGDITTIQSIHVRWPGPGQTQTFTNLATGRFYHLIEGHPLPRESRPPTLRLRSEPSPHPHPQTSR